MTAIADASSMPLWSWQTWLFLIAAVAIVGAVGTILTVTARPHRVPLMGADLYHPDRADMPRCHLRCGLGATVTRTERDDLGGQVVRVCVGHADEGTRRGWWA